MSPEQLSKPKAESKKFIDKVQKDLSPWGIDLKKLGLNYKLQDFLSKDPKVTSQIIEDYFKADVFLKKMYGEKGLSTKEIQKIQKFTRSFSQYLQSTPTITKDNFKQFVVGYMKKNPSDYKAIVAGLRVISHSTDDSVKKITELLHTWSSELNNIFNEILNDLFKPGRARSTLYGMIGIDYERMGYDRKLANNQEYQVIMKGVVDEMMSLEPVIEYFAEEPMECAKAFIDMMRPIDQFINTLKGMVESYLKMFTVDVSTAKGQYEVGKGITQRILTLLGGFSGAFKNIATKIGVKAIQINSVGPGMRSEI